MYKVLLSSVKVNYNPGLLQRIKDFIYNILHKGEVKNCNKCIYMIDKLKCEVCLDNGSEASPHTQEFVCLCPKHRVELENRLEPSDTFHRYVIGRPPGVPEKDPNVTYMRWIACKSQRGDNFRVSIQDKTCGKRGRHFVKGTPMKYEDPSKDNRIYQPGGVQ